MPACPDFPGFGTDTSASQQNPLSWANWPGWSLYCTSKRSGIMSISPLATGIDEPLLNRAAIHFYVMSGQWTITQAGNTHSGQTKTCHRPKMDNESTDPVAIYK